MHCFLYTKPQNCGAILVTNTSIVKVTVEFVFCSVCHSSTVVSKAAVVAQLGKNPH